MLPIATIREIDRLLKAGELSYRQIAVRMGVSRGTISALANGHRGLFGAAAAENDHHAQGRRSPPTRCRRCGYRVYLPCLICIAREYGEQENGSTSDE